MHEPLLERIGELERSNRRWKTACAILSVVLAAFLVVGGGFFGFVGYRAVIEMRAMRDAEMARMMEAAARAEAEAARAQAERALQKVQQAEQK